jgi:hypothetical protein
MIVSCSSTPKEQGSVVDKDLMAELCKLERNYAKTHEKKSEAELDEICRL